MEVAQTEQNLCTVEFGPKHMIKRTVHFLIEVSNSGEVEEELAAWTEFESEVELLLRLERISQINDKWMFHVLLIEDHIGV